MNIPQLRLSPLAIGGAFVQETATQTTRLVIPQISSGYADAQMDDYRTLPRGQFLWRPPLRLSLKARASHPKPLGTLGFGFWNDPFTLSLGQGGAARRLPSTPRTLWFFYGSPPNEFAFTHGVPGSGWKAASLNTIAIPPLLLAPLAATGIAMSRVSFLRRWIIPKALRTVTAAEVLLDLNLMDWHLYSLTWKTEGATFEVDGETVLLAPSPPQGPLGLVIWIDNQYAIVSPEHGFHFGVLQTQEEQWLEFKTLMVKLC